jgi:phosphonatase-like hydrolase
MKIELVVFDMAGTTVHDGDAVHRALMATLSAHGTDVTRDQVNAVMGLPKPEAIRRLLERPSEARVAALHEAFLARMVAYYRESTEVREITPAREVFAWLRGRGIKVALDTGFSRPIVDAILDRLGWRDGLLDATVASDEVRRGRPHRDLVFRAMELTGVVDAKAVAKVGDTPADLREGTDAGCGLVIGVTEGSHRLHELEGHPHTHLIRNVGELPALVESARGLARE